MLQAKMCIRDSTWYLIKSIDLDGTQLNEGWFKGPITLTNFTRHYFRPAGYEQVEWNFPFHYKNYTYDKPIPETVCLMNLIDKIQPQFMYSLHNAGFGGTYWYLTRESPELWDKFYAATAKQNIPPVSYTHLDVYKRQILTSATNPSLN